MRPLRTFNQRAKSFACGLKVLRMIHADSVGSDKGLLTRLVSKNMQKLIQSSHKFRILHFSASVASAPAWVAKYEF